MNIVIDFKQKWGTSGLITAGVVVVGAGLLFYFKHNVSNSETEGRINKIICDDPSDFSFSYEDVVLDSDRSEQDLKNVPELRFDFPSANPVELRSAEWLEVQPGVPFRPRTSGNRSPSRRRIRYADGSIRSEREEKWRHLDSTSSPDVVFHSFGSYSGDTASSERSSLPRQNNSNSKGLRCVEELPGPDVMNALQQWLEIPSVRKFRKYPKLNEVGLNIIVTWYREICSQVKDDEVPQIVDRCSGLFQRLLAKKKEEQRKKLALFVTSSRFRSDSDDIVCFLPKTTRLSPRKSKLTYQRNELRSLFQNFN